MPREVQPLALRIAVQGSQKAKSEVRSFAASLEVVKGTSEGAGRSLDNMVIKTRQLGDESGKAKGAIGGVASETEKATRNAQALASATYDGVKGFNGMANSARSFGGNVRAAAGHVKAMAGNLTQAYGIFRALKSGGPFKLLDAVLPAGFVKKVSMGMIGAGVAEGALLGKGVQAAGTVQQIRTGFVTSLGSEKKADGMLEDVRQFDAQSPFDFEGSAKGASLLLAMGTEAKNVIPTMYALGDALGATGQASQESFNGAIMALGQMQAKGKLSMEEINQLAERGIPALDILSKKLQWTQQQRADFMGGKLSVDASVGLPALREGMSERFKGGMDKQAGTLQGQINTLQGGIFQLEAAIGQHLLPMVAGMVGVLNQGIGAFNGLPEPFHKAIAFTGAFSSALLVLAGVYLYARVSTMGLMFAFKVLSFQIPFVGKSVAQLSWSLITKLVPSLASTAITIGTVAIAAAALAVTAVALYYAFQNTKDAMSQSNAQLEYHYGALGSFWTKAGEALNALWNHPLFRLVAGGAHTAISAVLGLGNGTEGDEETDRKALAITNASRKRRGLKAITKAEQDAVGGPDETVEDVRKREEKAKSNPFGNATSLTDALKKLNLGKAGSTPSFSGGFGGGMGSFSRGGAEQSLFDEASPDVQAAMEKVDSLASEIEQLQDAKRNTSDKDLKKTLGDKIIAKQRLLRAARRELAAIKKLAGRRERDAARAEKAGERARDAVQDNEFEISKANIEGKFSAQASDMERALKAAKESGDSAKIKRITFDMGHQKARQELEIALLSADREKDAKVRTRLRKRAQNSYRLAQNAAALDARNAALDAEQERQDTERKGSVDVQKAELQNNTDARLAPLEEALDAAKEAADFARIRSITLQIESLKAEQQYAEERADATLEKNAERRKQMERLANAHRSGALAKAAFAADKAVRDAKKGDESSDKGAREALARMRAATMNPLGFRALQPGGMTDGVPSLSNYGDVESMKKERMARIASMSQDSNGDTLVKFETIRVPYAGIGGMEVN